MKKGTLVGIVGLASAGKDTVADILVEQGFVKDSFAKTLKDTASVLFGWDRDMLDGTTVESRKWREIPDKYWANETGDRNFTPRYALQALGTEAIRETFSQNFWVSTLTKRYVDSGYQNTVVTDCRFPNEINTIREYGGKIIHISRGEYPDWYDLVSRINTKVGNEADHIKFQTLLLNKELPHASEYAWAGQEFDIVLDNNSSLDDLKEQVSNLKL